MDWKKAAIEDLRNYNGRKESLENIKTRISALNDQCASVKCSMSCDSIPVQGGGTKIEDRILSNLVERERLKHTYQATKKLVELTERGLACLGDNAKLVLERFYISPGKGNVQRLCDELGYEQAQVYRVKDQALYDFTIREYGLPEY